jgi:hypothetical protein
MNQNHQEILGAKRKSDSEQHHTPPTLESSITSPQSDRNKRRLIDPSLNPALTVKVQQESSNTQPPSTILPVGLRDQSPRPKEPRCNIESALSKVHESLNQLRDEKRKQLLEWQENGNSSLHPAHCFHN